MTRPEWENYGGPPRLKILYHHRTRAGDAQGVHILEMVNAFRQLGHEVEIVSLVDTEQSTAKTEDHTKESLLKKIMRSVPFAPEIAQLGYNLFGFALLARRLKGASFIYERYSLFTFAGVLAGRIFRVPVVLEVNSPLALEHHAHREVTSLRFASWIERRICNAATVVVVVSTPLRRILTQNGVDDKKIIVLPNGINPEQLGKTAAALNGVALPALGDKVVIGFVGWFRRWHGLETLVEAFHSAGLHNQAVLMLVGDGPARPELEALVAKLGIGDSVVFTGAVPHAAVGSFIRRFDIAMQPAANEYCCPMKIIEYMGVGKAILAPRQENIQELLTENTEAAFFEPENRDSMARSLLQLAGDAATRKSLGEGALRAISARRLFWSANAEAVIARLALTR